MTRWTTHEPGTPPLRALREAAGLSQGDAAEALGRPNTVAARATVSSSERRGDVLLSTLREWAAALGYEVEIRWRRRS